MIRTDNLVKIDGTMYVHDVVMEFSEFGDFFVRQAKGLVLRMPISSRRCRQANSTQASARRTGLCIMSICDDFGYSHTFEASADIISELVTECREQKLFVDDMVGLEEKATARRTLTEEELSNIMASVAVQLSNDVDGALGVHVAVRVKEHRIISQHFCMTLKGMDRDMESVVRELPSVTGFLMSDVLEACRVNLEISESERPKH